MRAIRALVQGHVQGVFFRAYTRDKANELNLAGWVRNNPDGTVECQVQGIEISIDEFIQFLHQGSPSSQVDDVTIIEIPVNPNLHRFEISY
ncbi:MAG: acylphosphatase [Promethearchaeota archaeon]